MKYPAIVIATTVLLVMPSVTSAQSAPAGFTVAVKSGTVNGSAVVGDEVTLELFKGQDQISTLKGQVGADGRAVFANVPTGPELSAVACAKHQNMAFRSEPVPLSSATGELAASVQVFDVSTDASPLSIGIHHIMVAARSSSLEFTEYMQLKNASDKAVIGAVRDDENRPIVIRFMLPAGFRDLTASSYLEPEAVVLTSDGFYDTMAVPPGEHQVAFSYKVDIGRGTTPITKRITLPTAELILFWARGQGRLEGLGEPNDRLVSGDGTPMEYYRRSALRPGESVTFAVSGVHAKESNAQTWIVLVATFVGVALVAVLRLRSGSKRARRRNG